MLEGMRCLDMRDYPRFSEYLDSLPEWRWSTMNKNNFECMMRYLGYDVQVFTGDRLYTVWMREEQVTWFVLKWS